jgi:hypothetical protein
MPSWGPTLLKKHLSRSRLWQSARLRQHGRATVPIGRLFAASDSQRFSARSSHHRDERHIASSARQNRNSAAVQARCTLVTSWQATTARQVPPCAQQRSTRCEGCWRHAPGEGGHLGAQP